MNIPELQILAAKYAIKGICKLVARTRGQCQTITNDSCSLFLPNPSIDNMQFPNIYFDKSNRFVFEVVYLLFWT